MISNYNLDCDYHNFELKDKIYLIPESALKIIYTDDYNEAIFTGDDSNVTILEGYDISFQEESSFDERFKFSRTLSIKVDGYKTFNDLNYRYMVIIETKDGEFYIVNSDFQSFVTHTYTLTNGTNSTELVFSSQSNIPTIKLTGFEPNVVNFCKEYNIPKIRKFKLTDASLISTFLSTWKKSLINNVNLSNIEPLPDSISLQEEFDGEKYTVTLGFDIPMNYFKNDWHIKLLEFEKNKYRGYVQLEDGNIAFVGYNTGLFPSYTINGDIISIRLTETSIRGISYGNDYAVVDTDMPKSIVLEGETCQNYNFESSCNWEVESKPDYITINPTSGNANTKYHLQICNTDTETGYAVSEFVIRSCSAEINTEVIIKNPIYRWVDTYHTICVETHEYEKEYLTFVALEDDAVFTTAFPIEFSLDRGRTWISLPASATTPAISAGKSIMWKNYNSVPMGPQARFSSTNKFDVQGNLLSILWGDDFVDKTTLRYGNASADLFSSMFEGCTGLTNACNLIIPVTNMDASFACFCMFSGCTSLLTAPDLPATAVTHDAYCNMFRDCTSLIEPPVFCATTVGSGACSTMFAGCSSLETAPVLPATALTDWCYYGMFLNCTSLNNVPSNMLPALDLGDASYGYMFSGCTSLEAAPNLPATGLTEHCYAFLFKGCSSLTSVPVLPATSLRATCYYGMFEDCTSLEYVPFDMLPATYLRQECYEKMFHNCTSLQTSPLIRHYIWPEVHEESSFFVGMFSGCTSLNKIICTSLTGDDWERAYHMYKWVCDVAPTGIFIKQKNVDWGNCSTDGIPCGWEVYDYATERTISGTPYCTGQNQYVEVYDQISNDYGVTWETTATTTELVDECAPDCGCYKILMYGIDGDDSISGAAQCNNSTTITSNEVNSIAGDIVYTPISGYQHVIIGTCCTAIGNKAIGSNSYYTFSRPTIEDFENFDRITSIGEYGMAFLTGLKSIDISNLTNLGFAAFSGCKSLSSVTIPSAVTLISADAFSNCSGLTSVTIEEGVETIGGGAFEECTSLSSITIPNSVTTIGDGAFQNCGLTGVTIPSSITEINSYAFNGCSALTSAYLPSSVSKIHYDAFTNCPNMESITIDRMTPPTLVCKYSYQSGQSCRWWSTQIIYVPAAAVNTYKNATGYWAAYHDNIRPIPT